MNKYTPFKPLDMPGRKWPSKAITSAPVWCSVDLRDGNQALVQPMNPFEKIKMFKMLCEMGFKEIEIGFPSSNDTEFDILRQLIEKKLIPHDVSVQVLVQAREHLIRRTFEAIEGAENVILHLYNSIGEFQQEVVFKTDSEGVVKMATEGASLINKLAKEYKSKGMNIRYEYSPEHFSNSDIDLAIRICDEVIEALDSEEKVIINLPSTVESSTPNCYADQIEYFCEHLKNRDKAIISVHTHNDRGTAIAATELALLAGAERVEGTLFGNAERTGNVDIITLALNMFSQGIDPKLNVYNINEIKSVYETVTGMTVGPRQPYSGELVFTAFSGSHQDAINKGMQYAENHPDAPWAVPYLPIDPADIGREFEPIIRINSQSGKGGAAYIMATDYGYILPKAMHPEFGKLVTDACVIKGSELSSEEVLALFEKEYIDISFPIKLIKHSIIEESTKYSNSVVTVTGTVQNGDYSVDIEGKGNGPIDAFFNALTPLGVNGFKFISYHEHAISSGSDSKAIAYIELQKPNGDHCFGVGISHNINLAPIRGVISAINRAVK